MIVAFTICSNNYLAHAIVLGKSWLRHHPGTRFVIVLVDELSSGVDYDVDDRFDIVPLSGLGLADLPQLVERYNITELNTAIKADAFLHIAQAYVPDTILYIDPDIQVYGRFDEVFACLETNDIVVTPHYCTPIDDGKSTTDVFMLNVGLFNLGFLAITRPEKVMPFFHWWRDRLHQYCHCKMDQGMFYDQVWVNYLVVFFDNWHVLKHPGYNMANWNFHERRLSQAGEDAYLVNDAYPLRFFHFSGFRLSAPDTIAHYHTRYTFAARPDLVPIFRAYREACLAAGAAGFSRIPCVYYERHKKLEADAAAEAWKRLPLKRKLARTAARYLRTLLR